MVVPLIVGGVLLVAVLVVFGYVSLSSLGFFSLLTNKLFWYAVLGLAALYFNNKYEILDTILGKNRRRR